MMSKVEDWDLLVTVNPSSTVRYGEILITSLDKKTENYITKALQFHFILSLVWRRGVFVLGPDGFVYLFMRSAYHLSKVPTWFLTDESFPSKHFTIYKATTETRNDLTLGDFRSGPRPSVLYYQDSIVTKDDQEVRMRQTRPLWVDEWDLVELFT